MQLKNFLPAAFILLLAAGCDRVDFKKTKSGLVYRIYSDNKSPKVASGQILKLHFSITTNDGKKDSVIQSSRVQGAPFYMPVNFSAVRPYDFSEIVPQLRKGDSAIVIQSMDTFLRKDPVGMPPFFKKGGKITTTVKVIDIFRDEQEARADDKKERDNFFKTDPKIQGQLKKDEAALQAYFQQQGIQAQKTPTGAYVQILSTSNGKKVQNGDVIDVFYTGRSLGNPRPFDSNVDTSFHKKDPYPVRIGAGGSIPGFEDGLAQLKEGDKARIFIPSVLGYGSQGQPQAGIAPDAILQFDVEVRRIVPAKQQETAPPPPPAH